ncbi:two-component response regulator ARR12-like [Diospyros lotus]|uniref:two-component response regulator ARR12-like n=1 Tax=Diospyros lotus TaxID=55363 RepID=UPI00224FA050|nr:two-component response regulator ARR12-like [Diospyros lotus]
MTVEQKFDQPSDQFPVGMRVLAVDDDPICLRLLETLLRKCQYHVTTTSQAITALKLLRENKNKFDLVISDVQMPDMDGFKLLELVGLEMDLPVIMLSGNGDTKLVMNGIIHGACDYLLKPVRMEELKNIWQHVVRRKKFDSRDQNNSDKPLHESEGGQAIIPAGDSEQNVKLNRKRKDQNEDEDEDRVNSGPNNEDPSTQKKPRVVWTVDLHHKFVAAVNHLGIDKAVPKRILDMMNVEKLTRENVASHLQKYRLYLKRISCVASQQANMAAALSGSDSAYLRMTSLNGFGNFHGMASSAQFQNAGVRSFSSGGMLGRLNTAVGLGMRGLSPSGMVQLGHAENLSSPVSSPSNYHPSILSGNPDGNILHGMPLSLEFDQLQQNKAVDPIGDLSTVANDPMIFAIPANFLGRKVNGGSLSNPVIGAPCNQVMLQGHAQEIERGEASGNQSVTVTCSNMEFPSHLPDFGRCTDGWSAIQSSEIQTNSYTLSECFKHVTPSLRNNISSVVMDAGSNSHDISSASSISAGFPAGPGWDDNKLGISQNTNLICGSTNSVIPPHGVSGEFSQKLGPRNAVCNRNDDFNVIAQPNLVNPLTMPHNEFEPSGMESTVKLKQGYLVEQKNSQNAYTYTTVGSLEDLVNAMMKQEQDNLITSKGDFGFETHSVGTCT